MRRPGQIYAVGDYRVDVSRRALTWRQGGGAVPIAAQPFDVLLALCKRPGDLVERSTLLHEVWPNSLVVDNSLSQAIAALRRALEDNPAGPRYIQTISRRGYRLLQEVRAEDQAASNPDAYQLFAVGWSALTRPDGLHLAEARRCLEEAINLDADFAMAYVCLALTEYMACMHGQIAWNEAARRMRRAMARAMELAPGLSEVHAMSGKLIEHERLDFLAAARCYQRALEINPNCYWGQRLLAMHLIHCGRFDEAIVLLRACQALEPLAVNIVSNIGMAHFFAGQLGEAERHFDLALRMDPAFEVARGFLGRCYREMGDFDRAMAEFTMSSATVHSRRSDVPVTLAMSGRTAEAWAALPDLLACAPPFDVAALLAVLGEDDAAMDWLEKAVEARTFGFFAVDPLFKRLRPTERFQALVERLRIKPL
jgi:adenylate cyclase